MQNPRLPSYLLVMIYSLLLFARAQVWTGAGIDQVHYYAQVASPLWDGDVDFSNDILESRNGYGLRRQMAERLYLDGRLDLPFPIGSAIVSAPLAAAARGVDSFTGWRIGRGDRYAWVHRLAPSAATWTMMLAGLLAAMSVARRFTTPWRAMGLVLALFLGTNLCYYTWHDPAMAHGFSFALAALVVLASVRYRERPSVAMAAAAGALVGLAFLVRWQEVLLAIVPAAALLGTRRKVFGHGVAMAVAAVVCAAPQFFFWRSMYGEWALAPHGQNFFHLDVSRPGLVLFSPLNGWIYTHPLVGLLLLAFVPAARNGNPRRVLLWAALVVILLQIVVNSLPGDWWGGGAFGARRFAGACALLVLPGAMALGRMPRGWVIAVGSCVLMLLLVNMLAVCRWAQEPLPALMWGPFFEQSGNYLRLPFSSKDILFSSNFFSLPEATDRPRLVRLVFPLVVGAIAAAGAVAVRTRVPRRALPLALMGTVGYAVLWCLMLLGMEFPNAAFLREWNVANSAAFAKGDLSALRKRAASQPASGSFRGIPDLYRLEGLVREKQFAGAAALSETLFTEHPRMVLDAWLYNAEPVEPARRAWVEFASTATMDLPAETLGRLYEEALVENDDAQRGLLHRRLRGPRWREEVRKFSEDFWLAEAGPELRRRLRECLDAYPFWQDGYLHMVRLRLAEAHRAEEYAAELESLAREYTVLADYVARAHPDHRAGFEDRWRPVIFRLFLAHEYLGETKEMGELIERAEALGLREGDLGRLEEDLALAREFEERLASPDPAETADPPLFPPESISTVTPEWLRRQDGWSILESTEDGAISWRWSRSPVVFLLPSNPLPAGKVRLKMYAFSFPGQEFASPMKVDLYGLDQQQVIEGPQDHFLLDLEFELKEPLVRPVVRIYRRAFPVSSFYEDSDDNRSVSMTFSRLWFEKER